MEWLKFLLLGLIQGLTEPLPISSSAHLAILAKLLAFNQNNLALEIWINCGSMIAIIFFLRKEILKDFFNNFKPLIINWSLIFKLFLGSIFILITGLLFKDHLNFSNQLMGISLLLTSLLLISSRWLLPITKDQEISYRQATILGLFQSIAIIPGLSRSGTVLWGGLVQKINPKRILTFSFYLYLIVSFGGLIFTFNDLDLTNLKINNLMIAFSSSLIMTFLSIKWLYHLIKPKLLFYFGIYTLLIGIILLKIG